MGKRTLAALLALWLSAAVTYAQHVRVNGQTIAQFVTATITTLTATTANITTANVSGVASFASGVVGTPSIAFTAEPTSGFWREGAGILAWSIGGAQQSRMSANALVLPSTGTLAFGSSGVTSSDTGISRSGVATLAIGSATPGDFTGTLKTTTLQLVGKPSLLNNVTTAGMGTSIIVAQARVVAATNVGTASVATFTPAADGTFEVGCNVLVTTSTNHTFSCDTTYTDESNVARTMVMPVEQLAGTFATSGLITNVTGAGPYESAVLTIRAKASTAIVIRTSAGGTFTGVVYNIDGTIKQVG